MVRVRFAPSPTGPLHIGGVRTALYNYLLAKQLGGTFILRIEDTDQNRFVEGAEAYIVEALKWCGIEPTEGIGFGDGAYGPYRQSERNAIYRKYAAQLIDAGAAYYAFDTPAELEAMRERLKNESVQSYSSSTRGSMKNSLSWSEQETRKALSSGTPYIVRLKIPENKEVKVEDLIRGEVIFQTNDLDDKVLMKADGTPTYHLANIVDDYLMRITHVIRGEEWLPSAGHHVLLYEALGWSEAMPKFAHLPLILRPDGKGKLSKRDGVKFGFPVFPIGWKGATPETSFEGFREAGFEPQAVLNFLALLGWNPGTEQEIFSLDEMVQIFSLSKINKSGARFDYDKAKWFNQKYLAAADPAALARQILPLAQEKGYRTEEEYLIKFVSVFKDRAIVINDFLEKGYYFFEDVKTYDQPNLLKKWKPENKLTFRHFVAFIEVQNFDNPVELETLTKGWMHDNEVKPGDLFPLLRIALTGSVQGPAIFEMMHVFGKEASIQRLSSAPAKFDNLL